MRGFLGVLGREIEETLFINSRVDVGEHPIFLFAGVNPTDNGADPGAEDAVDTPDNSLPGV